MRLARRLRSSRLRRTPSSRTLSSRSVADSESFPPRARAEAACFPQHSGDSSTSQGEVDKVTEDTLAKINASFEQNRNTVVSQLLDRVVQVEPKLHRNYKVEA